MKKLLLVGLPVLIIFMGLPFAVTLMVVMSTTAAAECRTQSTQSGPTELGDLGAIDGPVGGPVNGNIVVSQANIPRRSGLDGFRASMPRVLSTRPDFVTLNEAFGWSLAQIEAAAPGYDAFRVAAPAEPGPGAEQSMGNVVLWKRDTWSKVGGGRVQLVDDDKTYYKGRPVTWDRFATWVMLQRADGAVVSMISTHQMTNPHKYSRQHGNPPLTRPQQYGAGMEILLQLRSSLAAHGPVLIGGDMNTFASYTNLPWSAAAKLKTAGYGWYDHAVDFIFFPQYQGARLERGWSGPMVSDHDWISARIAMNGAGPEAAPETDAAASAGVVPAVNSARTAAAPPAGDVLAQLMQLRFASNYPTLTAEQARNAITIAQVARDLEVPRYGLQIAIAAAIQESKLVNLNSGDRDSLGLFQQRPSTGWGSPAQITNPVIAARAFFGQAQHTGNPGLLDIPGWQNMSVTQAAQAVQRSGYPDAYAQWEDVAGDIADLLGGDLPDLPDVGSNVANCEGETVNPITVGTLNLLGAGHTDGKPGGGGEKPGFDTWDRRLPGAMRTIENAGITIAGLQEVHPPQAKALAERYAAKWGMYPADGGAQNRVIWDRNEWQQTDARLVQIPYFGGKDVGMPLVQLTSSSTGQAIWVWSIHNPANVHGNAAAYRTEALRRELATMTGLSGTGVPAVILGDFNDGKDGNNSSHCALTPELSNAFGGSAEPCKKPKKDAPIDHVYGTNLTWASADVDNSTQANKIADHPLVVATTAGSSAGCAVGSGTAQTKYDLGPVKPQLTQLVNILGPMFDIKTVGGYRESATDPNGHPAGLAADFMVPLNASGRAQGDRLAAYAKANAPKLGIDYIIWYQRIWSVERASEGWRPMEDRGSDTENHLDHVHINVKPDASVQPVGLDGAACDEVVYPVPAQYIGTDQHNWHETGPYWSKWHSGTDFSAPCGTTVYAAHAGTIEIDTTQGWAGPQLVKVTTAPGR